MRAAKLGHLRLGHRWNALFDGTQHRAERSRILPVLPEALITNLAQIHLHLLEETPPVSSEVTRLPYAYGHEKIALSCYFVNLAPAIELELPDEEVEGDTRLHTASFERLVKVSQEHEGAAEA